MLLAKSPVFFVVYILLRKCSKCCWGWRNKGRWMEMVGCACAVSDGTGQKPPASLSRHQRPWHGAPGGQTDAVVLLDVYP